MLFALALAASLAATPVGAASPSSFTLLAQAEAAQPVHAAVPAEPVLRKSTNLLLIALELAVATGAGNPIRSIMGRVTAEPLPARVLMMPATIPARMARG